MRNNLPKIDEGLEQFLVKKGIDYEEFIKRDDLGEPDTIIAKALGVKDRRTINHWRQVRKFENGELTDES